jgi:biotin-dependent carboxylase-like uncharacterized protein
MTASLEVLATGPLATVQDLGRPGYAHWGVSWSGAADRASHRLANRLVGNPEEAATVEVTFGGLRVRPDADVVVAVTGAPCSISVDGTPEGCNAAVEVGAGQEVEVSTPRTGLRAYLAIRGGVDVAPVLGSRASDVLAELGPAVLTEGDRLPVGDAAAGEPFFEVAPVPEPPVELVTLRVALGPRHDWFSSEALESLLHEPWTAAADSNRIGLRLQGPQLRRVVDEELPSEGMVRGALQVPPTGAPTVFLADHPVTGGYPVIAVVLADDVDAAAQVRPGQAVRFTST